MGSHIVLWEVSLVLAVLCGAGGASPSPSSSSRCVQGVQYWNAELRRCVACTHCAGPGHEVTLRPCDGHRDALCGSIADLRIDWSWLRDTGFPRTANKHAHPGVHERVNALSEAEALLLDELHHIPHPDHPGQPTAHPEHPGPSAKKQYLKSLLPQPSIGPHHHDRLVDFGDDYILPDRPRQPALKKEKKHHKRKRPRPFDDGHLLHLSSDLSDFSDFEASGDGAGLVSDDEDLVDAYHRKHQRQRTRPRTSTTTTTTTTTSTPPPTSPPSLVEDFIVEKEVVKSPDEAADQDDGVSTRETFSTAETLVWDWQAGVLVAAVAACLLFFVVAAAYSCQHAWHFRSLKKHLDADMEEISARLALMSGMGCEHLHDPGVPGEKGALSARGGEYLHTGRQQNEYCLATMPRKTRV